jgi:signal transduction histidine kinase
MPRTDGPRAFSSETRSALMRRFQALSTSVKFAVIASLVIGLGMSALGFWVSSRIEAGVVHHTAGTLALYVESLIEPHRAELVRGSQLSAPAIAALDRTLKGGDAATRVVGAKIWSPDGRVLYSTWREQIGRTYPVTPELRRAFDGHIEAELDAVDEDENEFERKLNKSLFEVYVPVRTPGGAKVEAVAEVYELADTLMADIRIARLQSAVIFGVLGLAMVASLSGFVSRASRVITAQQDALEARVVQLSQLLEHNRDLQKRVVEASQMCVETGEQTLNRVSAELHDGPAQLISLALLRLDDVASTSPDDPSRGKVRASLSEALREIRQISAGLALPELERATLVEALDLAIATHERRTGTVVETSYGQDLPRQLPAHVVTCLYRVVQESLANAYRHAGGAGQRVAVDCSTGFLILSVSDRGPGFDVDSRRADTNKLGITGMRHRIEALGGELSVVSRPGEGTTLTARLPTAALGSVA